jgi:hypothetical protein
MRISLARILQVGGKTFFHRLKPHAFTAAVLEVAGKRLIPCETAEKHPSGAKACIDSKQSTAPFDRLRAGLKSCPFKTTGFSAACLAAVMIFGLGACLSVAQSATSKTPVQQQTAPAVRHSKGQIIFSRSTSENGQTTTKTFAQPAVQAVAAPTATDAERRAVTFTDFDLDVRLYSTAQQMAVHALVTVRNDGKAPLVHIPVQISSSLNWERIRVGGSGGQGQDVAFQVATLNSDADHTGQLHEAAVPLSEPLRPGQTIHLDLTYSGQMAASAQRLLEIGTPEDVALHSDWDQVGVDFTGLRGFGNVAWYPVSSVPVRLGDGARLFDAMGEHKLRMAGARFRLRLADEFPHDQPPTVAVLNGHSVPLTIHKPNGLDLSQEVAGVATANLDSTVLGFEAPSLFLAIRAPYAGENLTAWTLPDDQAPVKAWTAAATDVTPFLKKWLGPQPRSQLTLLDLPDPQDAPFETGTLLAAPLRETTPKADSDKLDSIMVHALAHAWMQSPTPLPAWLDEGVAGFMGTLWVEKQRGRDAALRTLEADRAALALAEPESPGQSAGQPLAQAISPVYYRTKAAYVLWMLRDLAGDPALSAALSANVPAAGGSIASKNPDNGFERRLENAGAHRDLGWFFADWVDADKGLPDLSIAGVFPTMVSAGNWLVAVDIANNGYASTEIPVTVRSDMASVTRRVLVPARGKTTERILIQSKPTEVQANDGTVPETQASVHLTRLDDAADNPAASSRSNPSQP